VAALIVGAEPIGNATVSGSGARRQSPVQQVEGGEVVWILRGYPGREERNEDDCRERGEARNRQPGGDEIRENSPERRLGRAVGVDAGLVCESRHARASA